MWLRTTNELGVNGLDDEQEDSGGEAIRKDGVASGLDRGGEAYQAWYREKRKVDNQEWVKRCQMHKAATTLSKAKLPNVEVLDSIEVHASKTLFCNKSQF